MISSSGGSKSMLGKATGVEPCGWMRDEQKSRRHGAKHIFNPKTYKHFTFGPPLEFEGSIKSTPSWRETNFQVERAKK